ncbi:MAG: hypothetical protein L3J23_02690 [Flavobacteriaceae bacterium]|nr:hypothetical protein [Flavobacteriaceae bacterium]
MTAKEKIIKYLKIKKISQDKFSRTCDISSGFLRQGKSFKIDLVTKIRENYPDLNLNYILFNEGDLVAEEESELNFAREESSFYENIYKKDLLELQKKHIKLHENLVKALNKIKKLKSKKSKK